MQAIEKKLSVLYNKEILRLATSIPHLGRLEAPHATAEKRSPLCGSRIIADVTLEADGSLSALGLTVNSCALGQASSALLGQHAIGKALPEIQSARDGLTQYMAGNADNPGSWPGLDIFAPAIPYTSRHAAIRLPFEALAEAMEKAGQS